MNHTEVHVSYLAYYRLPQQPSWLIE